MKRKLRVDERTAARAASKYIFAMCEWSETRKGRDYWKEVHEELVSMAVHGTTDGEPIVELPEGFRLAVDGDESREDAMVLQESRGVWIPRKDEERSFADGRIYIVPEDDIPTEEDEAVTRFIMVRNSEYDLWEKRVFVAIERGSRHPYKVADTDRLIVSGFQFARHLYPGE